MGSRTCKGQHGSTMTECAICLLVLVSGTSATLHSIGDKASVSLAAAADSVSSSPDAWDPGVGSLFFGEGGGTSSTTSGEGGRGGGDGATCTDTRLDHSDIPPDC